MLCVFLAYSFLSRFFKVQYNKFQSVILILVFTVLYPIQTDEAKGRTINEYFIYYAYMVTALINTSTQWRLSSFFLLISYGVLYYHLQKLLIFQEIQYLLVVSMIMLYMFQVWILNKAEFYRVEHYN